MSDRPSRAAPSAASRDVHPSPQLAKLERELDEARAQQAATSDILRVISTSPADTQPVFEAIVKSGLRFFPGGTVTLRLIRGDHFETAATTAPHGTFVVPLSDGKSASSRSVLRRETVQIPDFDHAPDWVGDVLKEQAARQGWRALLVSPLLREKDAIGVLGVTRDTPGAFSDREIALLETYAAQAVIAIENVRLFNELAEANRAKSRFLAAASHDLRQPVHALGLFVAQLQEARDAAARERIIEKIDASSAGVSQLVEALLDISRLDQGTLQPQLGDFPLQPMLDRLEQAFSMSAQAKDLRFRMRASRLFARTDPLLLERIVLNLVANAVRYTRDGGVLVGVRRRGSRARIEVWDTGIGIAPEDRQHIFEEFYRAQAAPEETAKGLGLGLTIVDRLARLLQLPVAVRSVVGSGSVFAVEVPLAPEQERRVATQSRVQDAGAIDGRVVLLVDDDANAREAAEGLLAQWGCRVLSASSGKAACDLLTRSPQPDVIVSDYRLGPTELGTDAVKAVRALLGRAVPAVIVSADSSATTFETIATAGLHLLRKPLKAAQLRVLLHHMIVSAKANGETTAVH